MHCFQRILVCVNEPDQPDPGLEHAIRLAKANDSTLTLVDAEHGGIHFWQSDRIRDQIKAASKERLDRLAAEACKSGSNVRTQVLDGRPAVAITREVIDGEHDLVIKTSRAAGLATRLFFGSTAICLMRICPAPVWIIQPDYKAFHKVMAAIDPFDTKTDDQSVNARILQLASSLSQAESCQLHVASVIPIIQDSPLLSRQSMVDARILRREMMQEAERNMAQLNEATGRHARKQDLHRLEGVPGDAIAEFVKKQKIDLIVMGTVARSGLAEVVMGDTAERVLHSVECSVLAVKPFGFVSPVAAQE